MKKLLFVYNPFSGKGAVKKYLSDILSFFTSAGYDVTVHSTAFARDGQEYIQTHAMEYDLIVCSGGDGMLHELMNGVVQSNTHTPCGYIPTGTVNDFASSMQISMQIPKDPIEAAKMVVSENFKTIDLGKFNQEYFAYVAMFGMFSDVSYVTNQKLKNMMGTPAYLMQILKSMDLKHFNAASRYMKINYNDKFIEDNFIMGLIGNIHSVAGMKQLSPPKSDMQDRLLDGMFIRTPKTILELERIKLSLINQTYDCDNITCMKSAYFTITAKEDIPWTLDGEYGGSYSAASIYVKPGAVQIAVLAEPPLDIPGK